MELLIPGLLLVALMVYASTRIKRVAAEAFEPETVDTELFSLEKPEGFLNIVHPADGLEFESYSRDYGLDQAAEFRMARFEVRRYRDRRLNYALNALRQTAKITSETPEVIDGRKYVVVEAERVEKGVGMRETYKIAESGNDVIELKLTTLEDMSEDISAKSGIVTASFVLK